MFARVSAAVLVLVLALVGGACSSSDDIGGAGSATPMATATVAAPSPTESTDSSTGAPGVLVLDAGAEPRVVLGISGASTSELRVSAVSSSTGSVGGESVGGEISATYELTVALSPGAPGEVSARLLPTLIETSGVDASTAPTDWVWDITTEGVLQQVSAPPVAPGRRLAELLSPTNVFLMVPADPVGAGAVWEWRAFPEDPPLRVELASVDDGDVTASITAISEGDGGSIVLTADGRWSQSTLLPVDVTSRVEIRFESSTVRNGEDVPVDGSTDVEFRYEATGTGDGGGG